MVLQPGGSLDVGVIKHAETIGARHAGSLSFRGEQRGSELLSLQPQPHKWRGGQNGVILKSFQLLSSSLSLRGRIP